MYNMTRLPFYLVELRPWPITTALRSLFMALGLINFLHHSNIYLLLIRIVVIIISIAQWWRDLVREATYIGKHTTYVQKRLRLGIVLFIIREICFFLAFFWTFFHNRLAPVPELGCTWPPIGIITIDPLRVPLLNTAILLASGFTVTWTHHALLSNNRITALIRLSMTIILGIYFTLLQIIEYIEATFTIADRVYGSIFFIATGFHGAHVIIGSSFLLINLLRILSGHFSTTHHFRFEAAAWYWHFVDVVWLCLYICIYWWGSL